MVETPANTKKGVDPSIYAMKVIGYTLEAIERREEPRFGDSFDLDGPFSIAAVLQTLYLSIRNEEDPSIVRVVDRIFRNYVVQNITNMTEQEQAVFAYVGTDTKVGALTQDEQQFIMDLNQMIEN
jgi:hypothetical protein